jgi:hypothetical protein
MLYDRCFERMAIDKIAHDNHIRFYRLKEGF